MPQGPCQRHVCGSCFPGCAYVRTAAFAATLLLMPAIASPQYLVEVWTTARGLPQNVIRAIKVGSDHYLWLTTLDGLVRFDGLRFEVFSRATHQGIGSNRLSALHEADHGEFWFGTENGGVVRYAQGRFTTYTVRDGLPSNAVSGVTADDRGRLWVLSERQIADWDGERFRRTVLDAEPLDFVASIWTSDVFWAVSRDRLYRFARGRLTWRRLPEELVANLGDRFEEDGSAVWVTRRDGRPVKLVQDLEAAGGNTEDGRALRVDPHASEAILIDRRGRQWTFAVGPDLVRHLALPDHDRPIAFTTLHEDADGNVWLGTDGQGLVRVRPQHITSYSTAQGLIDRNVYAVLEAHDGAVWIGTWDRGLTRIHQGRVRSFTTADGLQTGRIMALAEDRAHQVWIATRAERDGGLSVFANGRLRRLGPGILPDGGLVAVIHQDREGAMWFGTTRGLIRHANGQSQAYTAADGLAGNDVRVIIDGGPGRLWVGTYGGLSLWHDGRVTSWTEHDGLPSNSIRALYLDRDGVLWIGTYDGGLGRFHEGRFTKVTIHDGLFNNGVFQILEDDAGTFWMTSNRGIHRVIKAQLDDFAAGRIRSVTAASYGSGDGMRSEECNGGIWPAGTRTRDGRLWLPTQDGVAVVDPAGMPINTRPPTVVVESAAADNRPLAIASPLRVAPAEKNLELRYTGISFVNGERVVFRYRLSGVDRDWVLAGPRRFAHDAHIPPGRYDFSVQAANSDGVWSDPLSVAVEVQPPYWQTWWFRTGGAVAIVGLAVTAYRRRITTLRRGAALQAAFAQQLIVAQESERQRIATELHDGLGQDLLIVRNRALIGAGHRDEADDCHEHFEEIAATAGNAIDEVRRIAYNLRPVHLDRLGLARSIEEVAERLRRTSQLTVSVDVAVLDRDVAAADAINCYRIVQECLSNVARHAEATTVRVQAELQRGEVWITVSDNGRGFEPRGSAQRGGRLGLGMASLAERTRMLGGSHTVTSRPGAGTVIVVRFPAAHRRSQAS